MDDNRRAQDIFNRLVAIQAALQSNLAKMAEGMGLSVAQASVAQDLAEHPGSTLQEVCQRLGWPKSSVSRLVDDLVNRGMAIRKVPAENRRTVVLSLNRTTENHCQIGTLDQFFPGAEGKLDAAEVEALENNLDRLLVLLKPHT